MKLNASNMSVISLQGVETVDTSTFITVENREKLENAKKTNSVEVRLFVRSAI